MLSVSNVPSSALDTAIKNRNNTRQIIRKRQEGITKQSWGDTVGPGAKLKRL